MQAKPERSRVPATNRSLWDSQALGQALEQQELSLCYQPQIDLRSNRIVGVEALLRWARPGLGFIPPAEFIPVAEKYGFIAPIGQWVLDTACFQLQAWRNQGLPIATVAVNVSAHQFEEQDMVDAVLRALQKNELASSCLELEITESVAMAREGPAVSALQQLRTLGVGLSIDDFGTGYSSLSQLQCCPVNKLKIDTSFVRHLASDTTDKALVQAIVFLGHSLNMRVTAEGVETEQQLRLLKAYQCDEIQGFLVSPPVTPEEIAAVMRSGDEPPLSA